MNVDDFTLLDLPLRSELTGESPYGESPLDLPIHLHANENPYQLPDDVTEAMGKALGACLRDLNRYPDLDALALREDLASYLGYGLTSANVWAANGSNELTHQLLLAFGGPGHSALGFIPSYPVHPLQCRVTNTAWIDAYRDSRFDLTPEMVRAPVRVYQPAIVFLCSPNNPTGTALRLDTVEVAASEAPGLVIVDEAYAEFARDDQPSAVSLVPQYPRLVVTRTMSTALGFAGGRLGYLAAHPALVEALQLVRLPFHLSTLTQAAARAALAHASTLLAQVDTIRQQRDRIIARLRELGFQAVDSDANFVMFGRFSDQRVIWRALAQRGIQVRDVGQGGWLRVTAGTPAETDAFLDTIGQLAASLSG
jgi:histidinol-phosphate aminotransferase